MDYSEIYEENEIKALIQELLDGGYITHPTSVGVAKKIISDGLGSLRGNQNDVYNDYIEPIFSNDEKICKRCQCSITDLPYNERYALLVDGYCPSCSYKMDKELRRDD